MRKLIAALTTLAVLVAVGASATVGRAAGTEGCLTINPKTGQPYFTQCVWPKITPVTAAKAGCTKKSTTYKTGTFLIANGALIRTIVVKFGSKVIYSKSFGSHIANAQLRGTSSYVIGPLSISTAGLAAGAHSFTIYTNDWRPTSGLLGDIQGHQTRVVNFSVCATTPKTTG